ncbi:PHB depolymerase family esterase [Niveibacterium sp. COAC-50]|uniref:extracellular catalytic domain type 1 short-chain-length polyhydroxyalkanoate depolymerase n=1 Tax=Niveibacterium sp. COAC-50 TaxID=2729384 RepID=UPI001C1305F3|nr:PHB depolymerase family esterase [Niveibacterium sp. COAC-50]
MTRTAMRIGNKALSEGLQARKRVGKRPTATKVTATSGTWTTGLSIGTAGPRRYRLYKPPGVQRNERLPLLVMLHGCGQDAEALARSSRMNSIASRERFFVLYPEQDRLSNLQSCWHWYDTRAGRAQTEANSILAAIEQICLTQAVDRNCVALAGLSAGAGMATLLATYHPHRFRAVAMHSGIAPGVAHSSAGAIKAMFGKRVASSPLSPVSADVSLPALLVIHGVADQVVALSNGTEAAMRWGARVGARANTPRRVQRGTRYAAIITDYRKHGRLVATLCAVDQLGHAWSGGTQSRPYSDPKGPDASRMIWSFIAKQFAASRDAQSG